ncbi:MAG: holo-ACP synthase [Nitrospinota bacterium]
MILGVGVDLVEAARMRRALERWGERLLGRLFTDAEREYCEGRRERIPCYAARFAAKEAAFKALGVGLAEGLRWKDVEVERSVRRTPVHRTGESGQPAFSGPRLRLSQRAAELARERGVHRLHLSLSHTPTHALAQVILEGEAVGPPNVGPPN